MKPILRYIRLENGRCGLSTDSPSAIRRQVGTDSLVEVRRATQKDVDWVRGMGGYLPDGRIVKGAS